MASIPIKGNPSLRNRRSAGLIGVIAFHALLIYALVTGLAQGVVKVIQQKVEVSVISEPPPPPPPPPPKIEKVVQPTAAPKPQAYVPPVVNPPPVVQSANAIQSVTSDPKPQPAPTPAPVVEAPKGPISAKANCSHLEAPEYPSKAQEDEIQGVVRVVFGVGADGKFSGISNIGFDGSIPPRYRSSFKSAISAALQGYTCQANSQLTQEFGFKLDSGS
ncbi:hypothetical protein AWB61_05020 [Chromobacterium sp. F49]|nr:MULTISPECIES: hypothetical protein [Chromobacterium]KUM04799.1 hypothetical protein Cv017_12390 [Chromobacterium subtsugae]KZE84751.1 hypothetical protein AWB61_05020 [Chromobacterium sp. F49]MBW7567415.1 hypothetical protein [Chromobacterium subtsugae]WSE90223.1 hypothetical protein U6115_15145 [Chromobacterium subtsugae]WVH58595.1 hypothetical protein U6151_15170 [Chromobacterium subtsugae]